jgi:type II secretory pathway pseudopilin PulG
MGILNKRIAALRRSTEREEGFTILEVVMAFGVLFIALLALARTATVAFTDVSFARQRQTANQLANQLLEEIRALPYDTVKKGLSSTDLTTTDPTNIKNCGGSPVVYRYISCTTGEKIVQSPGLPNTSPLVPHMGSFGPPTYSSTYAWRTYVTEATDVPSKGAYRVTVIVDWNPTTRGGARTEVSLQTLVFSPLGCIDTATHPFGAPCQAYFYGTGSAGGGTYTVTGTFFDEAFDSMSGSLLGQSADLQIEQILRAEGDVKMPAVSKTVSGTETLITTGVATAADSDPATGSGVYDYETVGPQSGGNVEIQDGGNRMTMTLASNATGASTSTTAAGGANACNSQIDVPPLPCGFATGTESGALTHTYNLTQLGTGTLLNVGTTGTPVTTYARRYKPVAAQNGLARETVSWTLPEIYIGAIPSSITAPNNWSGYWVRLQGFTATAQVEAGVSTVAPTVTISGGTVQTWNGNGYTTTTINAAGGDIPIDTVQENTTGQNQKEVEISGTVSVDPSTTSEVAVGTTRTEAKATIGAPITVEMNYVLYYDHEVQVDLDIVFTAGTAELTATYVP